MTARSRFQGVAQIWRYNRRFYLTTLGALPIAYVAALALSFWPRAILLAAVLGAFLWTFTSLAVSHYVYDRSSLYDFSSMAGRMGFVPREVANFHAGLDECSVLLRHQFPEASVRVFDIFDRREMTEPSIARARELSGKNGLTMAADWRALPAETGEFDAAFIIFAAHELRRFEARVTFFEELARVTRAGGAVVLIEHLRDFPNFLAFGPGFLHFFSRKTWLSAAQSAGLLCASECRITAFVHVFVFSSLRQDQA